MSPMAKQQKLRLGPESGGLGYAFASDFAAVCAVLELPDPGSYLIVLDVLP